MQQQQHSLNTIKIKHNAPSNQEGGSSSAEWVGARTGAAAKVFRWCGQWPVFVEHRSTLKHDVKPFTAWHYKTPNEKQKSRNASLG